MKQLYDPSAETFSSISKTTLQNIKTRLHEIQHCAVEYNHDHHVMALAVIERTKELAAEIARLLPEI